MSVLVYLNKELDEEKEYIESSGGWVLGGLVPDKPENYIYIYIW